MPRYDPDYEGHMYLCDCGTNSVVQYGYKCRECGKRWPVGYRPAGDEYWKPQFQKYVVSRQWYTCHGRTIRCGGICPRCGADPEDPSK